MLGGGITTKFAEPDCKPTVTVTGTVPPAAPFGTETEMLLSIQAVGDPALTPNLTVLEPAA